MEHKHLTTEKPLVACAMKARQMCAIRSMFLSGFHLRPFLSPIPSRACRWSRKGIMYTDTYKLLWFDPSRALRLRNKVRNGQQLEATTSSEILWVVLWWTIARVADRLFFRGGGLYEPTMLTNETGNYFFFVLTHVSIFAHNSRTEKSNSYDDNGGSTFWFGR